MKKIYVLFIVTIFTQSFANAQWQHAGLDSIEIRSLAVQGNNIIAGTYGYGTFITYDNANNWVWDTVGLIDYEVNVVAVDGNNIFAGTGWGLEKSYNNGLSWVPTGLVTQNLVYELGSIAIKGNTIYAGCFWAGVYLSTDYGNTWTMTNFVNDYNYALAIKGDTVFVGTIDSTFYSTDNGNSWTYITDLGENGVYSFVTVGNNFYAGSYGGVYLSTNNGMNWTLLSSQLYVPSEIRAVAIKGNKIFAGTTTYNDGVYLTTDNGNTWLATGLPDKWVESLVIKGDTLYAGSGYGIWKRPLSDFTQYTVTINANPTNGGAISGGGTFINYLSCTLNAIPDSGYAFVNWTENGNVLSTLTNYTFAVTANRNIVANFTDTVSCSSQITIIPAELPEYYYIYESVIGVPPFKYLWDWGDGTHDTIAFPTHHYSSVGNYTICLSITDSTGCTSSYCDSSYYLEKSPNSTITMIVIHPTTAGINTNELTNQIKVYPNPTKDNLTIETNSTKEQKLEILNLIGQTVYTSLITKKAVVKTGAFTGGVYFIKLSTDKETVVKKFVKE